MTFIIARIAKHLEEHGPTSTGDLAKAVGVHRDNISGILKCPEALARYGVTKFRVRPGLSNIWSTEADKRMAYEGGLPPKRKQDKPVDASCRAFPVYVGPHKTIWQPSSPYSSSTNEDPLPT